MHDITPVLSLLFPGEDHEYSESIEGPRFLPRDQVLSDCDQALAERI